MSANILKLPVNGTPAEKARKSQLRKKLNELRKEIAENGVASMAFTVLAPTDPDTMAAKHAARLAAKQRL